MALREVISRPENLNSFQSYSDQCDQCGARRWQLCFGPMPLNASQTFQSIVLKIYTLVLGKLWPLGFPCIHHSLSTIATNKMHLFVPQNNLERWGASEMSISDFEPILPRKVGEGYIWGRSTRKVRLTYLLAWRSTKPSSAADACRFCMTIHTSWFHLSRRRVVLSPHATSASLAVSSEKVNDPWQ